MCRIPCFMASFKIVLARYLPCSILCSSRNQQPITRAISSQTSPAYVRHAILSIPCTRSFPLTNPVRPSFLHLLFQYRRLFRVIATRDFKPNSAPLAIVCWVDVVLARLGDVAACIAAGLDVDHPDQLLPESLKARREEDNLRAAIQLPGTTCFTETWMYLTRHRQLGYASIHAFVRARVSCRKTVVYKVDAGKVYSLSRAVGTNGCGQHVSDLQSTIRAISDHGAFHSIHKSLSTFAEFVRQSAARVDGMHSVLEPGLRYLILQERLTSAMAISLFAVSKACDFYSTIGV